MMRSRPQKTQLNRRLKVSILKFIRLFRSISIEHQLRYLLIFLVLGNTTVVGLVAIALVRDAQWSKNQELQSERAVALAREVRTRLDDLQQQLSYLQKVRGLVQLPQTTQRSLLEGLTRESDAYEMIAIVNSQGKILSAIAPYSRQSVNYFVLSKIRKPQLKTAIQEQASYIDQVVIDPQTKHKITTLVLPLQDAEGQSSGSLIAMINLGFLDSIVARSNISETGYIYILDEQDHIIAKQRTEAESFQEQAIEQLDSSTLKHITDMTINNAVYRYDGLRGVPVLGTQSLIYGVNWRVVVELPLKEIYEPIRRLSIIILMLISLSILLTIILSIKISHTLVLPLQYLTQVADKISHGELSTSATINSRNEWRILANTFNYMTTQIRETFQALESKNAELSETLTTLQNTQTQLVQNEKMSSIGQLVAGVAHEINNPVNFIHANVTHADQYAHDLLDLIELYQQQYPEPDQSIQDKQVEIDLDFLQEDFPNVLNSMSIGSQRVKGIVLSLRNFSRLDEASFKAADIHEGIENTLIILQGKIKGKGDYRKIAITKNYGNLPLIECHPAQLNQVFMNLLSNAIDALEAFRHQDSDRQPQIEIATSYHDALTIDNNKGAGVCIQITDNAGGIPEEHQTEPLCTGSAEVRR